MPVKTIVKFVVSLSSLLKKKGTNYLKNIIFLLNFGLLLKEMGPFFFFFWWNHGPALFWPPFLLC